MFELFVGMDAVSKHGQRRSGASDTARDVNQKPSRLRAASARVLRTTAARRAAGAQPVDRPPSGERSAAVDCSPVN